MSHDNESYLRFSLEESVWFQKGQEVDDLISISLDPDITIQESDQYITIKGSLELTGEYYRGEDLSDQEENEDYFNHNPRTVQLVELREEEGIYAFTHQFPVEVTIPKNRIQDLEEIDVRVETFDYAFPENSCLRLTADLMIIGLYGEQQHEFGEQEPVEIEIEEIENDLPTFSDDRKDFDFAPYERPETPEIEDDDQAYQSYEAERDNETSDEDISLFSNPDIPQVNDELYEPFEVEARKVPEVEPKEEELGAIHSFEEKYPDISLIRDEEDKKETPVVEPVEPVLEETRKEVQKPKEEPILHDEDVEEEAVPEIKFTPQPSNEEVEVEEESLESPEENEEVLQQEEEQAPAKGKKKAGKKLKNKQSITLSEFFARKDEEEHTRLKMCIVQNGDTLEILSERYEVPASQIQRVNQMELNQDIYEGQVLYIPVAQTQR